MSEADILNNIFLIIMQLSDYIVLRLKYFSTDKERISFIWLFIRVKQFYFNTNKM